jgi:hypothetical protein
MFIALALLRHSTERVEDHGQLSMENFRKPVDILNDRVVLEGCYPGDRKLPCKQLSLKIGGIRCPISSTLMPDDSRRCAMVAG